MVGHSTKNEFIGLVAVPTIVLELYIEYVNSRKVADFPFLLTIRFASGEDCLTIVRSLTTITHDFNMQS